MARHVGNLRRSQNKKSHTKRRRRTRSSKPAVKARGLRKASLPPKPKLQFIKSDDPVIRALTEIKGGASLAEAAQKVKLDPRTLRRRLGSELYIGRDGKLHVRIGAPRYMPLLRADGEFKVLRVRGSRNIHDAAAYLSELQDALNKRTLTEFAAKWQGVKINGHKVLSDPAKLQELADAGILKLGPLVVSSRERTAGGAR